VVDFGIARIQPSDAVELNASSTGVGTPGYMAPEQHVGGIVTARTDVYAFGIVLSELLTGRHPLAAKTTGHTPARFAAIIARCVHSDPGARYASGRELLAALAAEETRPAQNGHGAMGIGSPRWWWEFHQAVTAAVYWLMIWPAWTARSIVGGRIGAALFLATLIAVIAAANLRLHLWFTSRFYPSQLRWARRRATKWIRAADWLFVGSLATTGILAGEDQPVAIVLVAVAVGAAIAFLIIEHATARAAFRNSFHPR
jgi:serine/threonine protein kinase